MPTNRDAGETSSGTIVSERFEPETPFLETYLSETPQQLDTLALGEWYRPQVETPFLTEYLFEGETLESPQAEAFRELLHELYDHEFEEAIADLAEEAAATLSSEFEQFAAGEAQGVTAERLHEREQSLEQWIQPLREQTEAMLESFAEAFEQQDVSNMSEQEVEALLDRLEPTPSGLTPAMEHFFGGFFNKLKKVAKGAWNLAKRGIGAGLSALGRIVPLRWLFRKLQVLARTLLARVLRLALGRLPLAVRPAATLLARRLLGTSLEAEAMEGELELESEQPASADHEQIQTQFDMEVASLLFAANESEQEMSLAESVNAAEQSESNAEAQLDETRADFIREIERLEEGEDPQQLLENFIPAILPALRLGIRIIGRPRIVGFIARYLSRLISPYVGRQMASPLSRAIVDAGLRMMTLEATPEMESGLSGAALAATVEDTVARLSEASQETLADDRLLEAAVSEAFREAAAENFPPSLLKPEARETAGITGTWVWMPLGRRPKRYKKFTQIFDINISPQMARRIRTFGGISLEAFLRDRLGIAPPVRARMHLYQAILGTRLGWLARRDNVAKGLGLGIRGARWLLHPLTPEAAGVLLQQPGLGRRTSARYMAGRGPVARGQRFYWLEIAGARPQPLRVGQALVLRRPSEVNLTIDFPGNAIRAFVFVSEREAQAAASALRRNDSIGSILGLIRGIYSTAVHEALSGDLGRRVTVLHEAVGQEQFSGSPLANVARPLLRQLAMRIVDWLSSGIADMLQSRPQAFIRATEDPADGVTLIVSLKNPPGLPMLRKVLKGEWMAAIGALRSAFSGSPTVEVSIVPGFRRA